MSIDDASPLGYVRDWLRKGVEEGVHCPACQQFAKVYRRKITSTMARSLIALYQQPREFVKFAALVGAAGGDDSKLVHWGLIEEEKTLRPDGGRAGYWQITDLGVEFVRGRVMVPKYVRLYDGRLLGPAAVPEQITIREALGVRFDYDELMRGV